MQPKLSIGSWAFAFGPFASDPWSFSRILDYASDAGYDGVEINGFAPHPTPELYPHGWQRRQLADEIRGKGLGISAYAPDFREVPPSEVEEHRYLERMKSYMAFAQEIGTDVIRVDTVTPPGPLDRGLYEERFARLAATWRRSAALAEAAGITIAWEFEPGFWLNKPSEVLRLLEAVDSPAFGVLFDTSHAYMSGVVAARQEDRQELLAGGVNEYVRLLENRVVHLHLIDSDGTLHDEETSTHAAFGSGLIDFHAFFPAAERAISNLTWWGVDFCFNAEVEAWGREAVPYLRNHIQALPGRRNV